ncbi:MAG: glycosyltransferase family 39 protein [Acidobacteriia bacterium]|nr:glycosyltransferase family 39 protein [Terriglobia bacterium]
MSVTTVPSSADSRTSFSAAEPAENQRLAVGWLLGLSGTVLLLHVLLSGRYGYFRDELYFLDCGRHLAWGYVDMAPMIALFSRLALALGAPLQLLRSMAAVGAAGIIAITMLIAWRLGGGRFAQALAGLCAVAAPMYLASGSLFTMNIFESWFWMGCAYVLIRIIQTGNSRLWIWFGVLAGLGLMNKHSASFFGLAVVVGLVLTAQRKEFAKRWIWVGGVIALLIFLPNLIWQVQHHFPTLEDLHNVAESGKNVVLSPVAFVVEQILVMHPLLFPVWLSGLWFFLMGRGTKYRPLGWIYLTLLVIFIFLHGKDYYLAPAYPMLFAGGAVAIDDWLNRGWMTARKLWPKAAIVAVIVASGAFLAPAVLPLLSPENQVAYRQRFHLEDQKTEVNHVGPLPQMFGDQFGWPELVEQVAAIYNSLPPEQRTKTAILAGNYGEAGAIDLFGPKYGLPTALSGHQTHYFWGTMGFTGDTVITIQYGPHFLSGMCDSVKPVGMHSHPWGMAEENHELYLCHLKRPLAEMWEDQKHWN